MFARRLDALPAWNGERVPPRPGQLVACSALAEPSQPPCAGLGTTRGRQAAGGPLDRGSRSKGSKSRRPRRRHLGSTRSSTRCSPASLPDPTRLTQSASGRPKWKSIGGHSRIRHASGVDRAPEYRITRVAGSADLADTTRGLLNLLPSWFGIPESNAKYVESATYLPGLVASFRTQPIGVLLHRRHFPEAAEIHVMAVDPSWHRRGVGRALVATVMADLGADGCTMLQVKTLGSTHPDQGYALTRAFYRAVGFLPLEETSDLWPGNPCLIMVRQLPLST